MANTGKSEQIGVRIGADLLAKLDTWRREQPDPPTRPEAIRQIVEQALDGKRRRPLKDVL